MRNSQFSLGSLRCNLKCETEQLSLKDIELYYSDNSKGIADYHICQIKRRIY